MINLFIDSNIWLSLYHFTSDDLSQFEKIKDLIGKSITLFVTQQVCDEVLRNREAKLKDAFNSFSIPKLQYPAFCKNYDEYVKFYHDYNSLLKQFREWKVKIDWDIEHRFLPADQTIRVIFNKVEILPCDDFVEKAYTRYKKGNPPGKDNKYGDAINWECLLSVIPEGEDLYFISADKDYRSELMDGSFNPFLQDEWALRKHSRIHYYQSLVAFLNDNLTDIQLAAEREKQELIDQLGNSSSFQNTHGIIAMLSIYTGWTDAQIEQLCDAAMNNNQVLWIFRDEDVYGFYNRLLKGIDYADLPDNSVKKTIEKLLSNTDNDELSDDQIIDKFFGH